MSEKNAYLQKLEAQLHEWNAEIDKLKAKAEKAEADARIDYQRQVSELRAMQADAERRLTELRNAGDGAWEDLKSGAENASKSLRDALRSAASRF